MMPLDHMFRLTSAVVIVALTPLALAFAGDGPAQGAVVVAASPPWQNAARAVETAGGTVLAEGWLPFFALTVFRDPAEASRMKDAGIWAFASAEDGGFLCRP